jgi:uncharacterized protein YjbI with pentapeptide repeats
MANEEQLSILKQGVEVWNRWRMENLGVRADLVGANLKDATLRETDLDRADLRQANLEGSNLWRADLRQCDLGGANLNGAYFGETNLREANLVKADFSHANLTEADLSGDDLREANFTHATLIKSKLTNAKFIRAHLRGADLSGSNLRRANFRQADLNETDLTDTDITEVYVSRSDFSKATVGRTVFGNLDLSKAIGLRDVNHIAPSTIGIDTLSKSKGKISEGFLQGCGLSDADIEYAMLFNPDLSNEEINKILYKIYDLRATQALQISPLFISYSHADTKFVSKIGDNLTEKGIRYWRDIHGMKAGRVEKQLDQAIRQNPTVLLVLSEHSLSSDWVEHEVRTARGLEKEMGHDVLCPIALDDSWKSSRWPKRIMEQIMEYNILDFSAWQDDSKFEGMFRKLIDGLELFYKG